MWSLCGRRADGDPQAMKIPILPPGDNDNGPQLGGRGDERLNRYNCNYIGCRGNVYEGGIRATRVRHGGPSVRRRSRSLSAAVLGE